MSNFGLPVGAGGRPPANTGGTMGLPVGMSLGQLPGSYGGVSQTHPGSTSQSTVSTRAQTAFNVQPQVTIAYRTQEPMPTGIRRKDFLFTFHPEVGVKNVGGVGGSRAFLRSMDEDVSFGSKSARYGKNITYTRLGRGRSATPSGVKIMSIADINQELAAFHPDKYEKDDSNIYPDARNILSPTSQENRRVVQVRGDVSAIHSLILQNFAVLGSAAPGTKYNAIYGMNRSDVQQQAAKLYGILSTPSLVANIFRPLGVYHNRATHDATERFGPVFNSNVSDIISVSKSNHCFMRDIWGIELFPGDQLGFLYIVHHKPSRYVVKEIWKPTEREYANGITAPRSSRDRFELTQSEYDDNKYVQRASGASYGLQSGWLYQTVGYLPASDHTEIVPHVGPWPPVDEDGNSNFLDSSATRSNQIRTALGEFYYNFQRYIYDLVVENELSVKEGETVFPPAYAPIGKVWAVPMHKAFNPSGQMNIVGPNSNDSLTPFESVSANDQKYHAIEVELSPFMKNYDL